MKVKELARIVGMEIVPKEVENWEVVLLDIPGTLANCWHSMKMITIGHVFNGAPLEVLRELLIHEVAHAVTHDTWQNRNHGLKWRSNNRRLGGKYSWEKSSYLLFWPWAEFCLGDQECWELDDFVPAEGMRRRKK